jgi:peptidoglycan DL-endopeptidase CwlO
MIRFAIFVVFALLVIGPTHAAEETLGEKIKKAFSTPTPTPTPHKKRRSTSKKKSASPSPSALAKKKHASPSPSASAKPKKASSPTPEPSESPSATATPSSSPTATASPETGKRGAPNATLLPDSLSGFESYPSKVRQLLISALELTTRNLDYKYGSADPANGGMDCSGFVYFVLKQNGIDNVPRDSSEQYIWLRKAGRFEPVVSQKEDSFEFDNLKPGDLLFWTGTYAIERDPPITHAMIYLGREKKTGARVMVGASDGRTYQNQQRFGVSVFDFKMPRADKGETEDGKTRPRFVGYAHLPGLRD